MRRRTLLREHRGLSAGSCCMCRRFWAAKGRTNVWPNKRIWRSESASGSVKTCWSRQWGGLLLESPGWVSRIQKRVTGDRRERPAFRMVEWRPDGESVREAMGRVRGKRLETFAGRHGDWGRDMALHGFRTQGANASGSGPGGRNSVTTRPRLRESTDFRTGLLANRG